MVKLMKWLPKVPLSYSKNSDLQSLTVINCHMVKMGKYSHKLPSIAISHHFFYIKF